MKILGKSHLVRAICLAVTITLGGQILLPVGSGNLSYFAPARAEAFNLGGLLGGLLMGAARTTVLLCTTKAMVCRLQAYNEAVELTHDPAFIRTANNEAVLSSMRNTASAGENVNLAVLEEETGRIQLVEASELDKRLEGLDANDAVVRDQMIHIGKLIQQADHWSGVAYAETAALLTLGDGNDRNLAIAAGVIIGAERVIAERLSPVHARIKKLIPKKDLDISKKEIKKLGKEITKA